MIRVKFLFFLCLMTVVSLVFSQSNTALYFEEASASCNDSGLPMGDNPRTIEAWIRVDSRPSSGYAPIFGYGDFSHGSSCYLGVDDSLSLVMNYGGDNLKYKSKEKFEIGEFYHVAFSSAGPSVGDGSLYINGVLAEATILNSTTVLNTISYGTAFFGSGPSGIFNGVIDEVRVWDVVRSSDNIRNNQQFSFSGDESNLVGYWDFNEGSGDTLIDLTANENHASINGANYVDGYCVSPLMITLNTDNDHLGNGECGDLRYAAAYAGDHPGPDTIRFDLDVMGGNQIVLDATLSIKGDSTFIIGNPNIDSIPQVWLRGRDGNSHDGIANWGQGSILQGLVISNFGGNGISKGDNGWGGKSWIKNCYIGFEDDGETPDPNVGFGVYIEGGRGKDLIGGDSSEGNLIYGGASGGISAYWSNDMTISNNTIIGGIGASSAAVSVHATNCHIEDNVLRAHAYGVRFTDNVEGIYSFLDRNSIYEMDSAGIEMLPFKDTLAPPVINGIDLLGLVEGTGVPGERIQLYADKKNQGELLLDTLRADSLGNWFYQLSSVQKELMLSKALHNITALQDSIVYDSSNTSFQNPDSSFFAQTSEFSEPLLTELCLDPLMVTLNTDNDHLGNGECGDLRYALAYATDNLGPDTIRFDLDVMEGNIIELSSDLEVGGDTTVIMGSNLNDTLPRVWLRGGDIIDKFTNASRLHGLIITNGGIEAGSNNTISNCYVGVKPDGVTLEGPGGIDKNGGSNLIINNCVVGCKKYTSNEGASVSLDNINYTRIQYAIHTIFSNGLTVNNSRFINDNTDSLSTAILVYARIAWSNGGTSDQIIANEITGFSYGVVIQDIYYQDPWTAGADGVNIERNELYGNDSTGIKYFGSADGQGDPMKIPSLVSFNDASKVNVSGYLTGTGIPNERIQLYADKGNQGQLFLDTLRADSLGNWSYQISENQKEQMLSGDLTHITALQDSIYATSEFSEPLLTELCLDPLMVTLNTDNDHLGNGECGDLRYALAYATDNLGPDTIRFDLDVMGGNQINIVSPLELSGSAAEGTVVLAGASGDTEPTVWLRGLDNGNAGFKLTTTNNLSFYGLVISNFTNGGILTEDVDHVQIANSYFGLALDGVTLDPNGIANVYLNGGKSHIIGSSNAAKSNRFGGAEATSLLITSVSKAQVFNNGFSSPSADTAVAVKLLNSSNVLIQGNTIRNHAFGIIVDGAISDSNQFYANEIYSADSSAIYLKPGTQFDLLPPVINGASFEGIVEGSASSSALLQLYADSDDQGRLYLDTVRATAAGDWVYSLSSGQIQAMQSDSLLNLTALQDSSASTSEFSSPFGINFNADSVLLVPLSVREWCYESNQAVFFTGFGPRFGTSTVVRLIGVSTVDANDTIVLLNTTGVVESELKELNFSVSSAWAQGDYMMMLDVGYATGPIPYEIVTILTVPEIPEIVGAQEGCHNNSLVFNGVTDDALSYNWQVSGGASSVIAGDSIVVTPTTGVAFTLYLDGANNCGASNMDTLVVALDSLPELFSVVTDPVMHCYGQEIAQAPTGSLNTDTIKWFGSYFAEIRISGPLTYVSTLPGDGYIYVAAENRCGVDVDSILVETHDTIKEVRLTGPAEVCSNSLLVLYEVDTLLSNYSYTWSVTEASMSIQDLTDSALVDFATVSGGIKLEVSNYCNSASETIVTTVTNLIDLDMEQDDDSVCIGQFSRMRVTDIPGYSYEWFELGNSIAVSSEANLTVNSEGQYWVEISFNSCYGASDTASVDVDYFTNNYDPFGADYYVCDTLGFLFLEDLGFGNDILEYRLRAYDVVTNELIGDIAMVDSVFTLDTTARYVLQTNNGRCTNTDAVTIGIKEGFLLVNDTVEIAHQEEVVLVTLNDFIWLNQNQYTLSEIYQGSNAEVEIVQDVGVLYNPNNEFSGRDSLQYQVSIDACPGDVAVASVYITVNPGAENDTLQVTDLNNVTDSLFMVVDTLSLIANDRGVVTHLEFDSFTYLGASIVITESGMPAVSYPYSLINGYVGTTQYDTMFYRVCDGVSCVTTGAIYEVRFPDDSITTVTDPFETLVHNIVSPNGDGINDFLKIEFYQTLPTGEVVRVLPVSNEVSVFTKWGDVVYSRSNYSNQAGDAFEGLNWNGDPLPSGTYYYAVEYELEGKKGRNAIASVKGFFLLVR